MRAGTRAAAFDQSQAAALDALRAAPGFLLVTVSTSPPALGAEPGSLLVGVRGELDGLTCAQCMAVEEIVGEFLAEMRAAEADA